MESIQGSSISLTNQHLAKSSAQKHKPFIGNIEQARGKHEWLVYNECILSGYRINHYSFGRLFKSICGCHNETTNIWSHFIAAIGFIFVFSYFTVYYEPFRFPINDMILKARKFGRDPDLGLTRILNSTIEQFVKNPLYQSSATHGSVYGDLQSQATVDLILESMRRLEINLKASLATISQDNIDYYS